MFRCLNLSNFVSLSPFLSLSPSLSLSLSVCDTFSFSFFPLSLSVWVSICLYFISVCLFLSHSVCLSFLSLSLSFSLWLTRSRSRLFTHFFFHSLHRCLTADPGINSAGRFDDNFEAPSEIDFSSDPFCIIAGGLKAFRFPTGEPRLYMRCYVGFCTNTQLFEESKCKDVSIYLSYRFNSLPDDKVLVLP